MVQGAADEPVGAKFAAKGAELGRALSKNRVGDATGSAKAGDDSADGGNFHLSRGVAHQINFAVADGALHGHPAVVDGNARSLPFQRFETFLFQKAVEEEFGCAALFADYADGGTVGRFGNHPVKIGRIVGNEPDARGVRGTILRKFYDSLNQRDGFDGRPAGGLGDAACGAIGADHAGGVQLFALAAPVDLDVEAFGIRGEIEEAGVVAEHCAGV